MMIDAHMHLTRPVTLMVETLQRLGFQRGVVCSSAVASGERISTLADARAMMERVAGVQNRATDRTVSQINRDIAAAVAQYPALLWGFGKVDLFQDGLAETVEEMKSLGMKGIGEIVGLHGNVGLLPPVLEAAGTAALPVFLHTDYPVDGKDLAQIVALAGRYPNTRIILGHAGGDFWIDAIAGAAERENLWLDTSEIVNQVALQVAANTVPRRLLFSSDFPWDSMESMLARIEALSNTDETKRMILGGNAETLLG